MKQRRLEAPAPEVGCDWTSQFSVLVLWQRYLLRSLGRYYSRLIPSGNYDDDQVGTNVGHAIRVRR